MNGINLHVIFYFVFAEFVSTTSTNKVKLQFTPAPEMSTLTLML